MEHPKTNEKALEVTEDDLLEANELADSYTLEECRNILSQVYGLHKKDPNFPIAVLEKIKAFLDNEELNQQGKDAELIKEMKIEAAIITTNSPYAEVRSVVDNHDDPSIPCSTIRAWVMGIMFSIAIAFINGFFEPRYPSIYVGSNVPQLLAYPLGKLCEKVLPDVGVTLFGVRHSLNPGPFNKKEHMLITIMASIAKSTPYTNYVVWIQYLPHMFNQPWAVSFGYQILIALSTNFIGYGLAGLCRRFLVYPAYCVWPSCLVTIALNTAFHSESNPAVSGPLGMALRCSRLRFFTITFSFMFVYFWFPNYIFQGLSYFSWMTWLAPNNVVLSLIAGSHHGLGVNPLPTLDWNMVTSMIDPLMIPFFTTFNFFIGSLVSLFTVIPYYWLNIDYTAYLPINSNRPFDHFARHYNISRILDDRGIIDLEKYQAYSPPFLSAGSSTMYMFHFATYTATITYGILHYHEQIRSGFREVVNSFRPSKKHLVDQSRSLDVHNRLMAVYPEVPEWWYMICLAGAVIVGCVGIACWPTYTSIGVVFYGIALCLIFVVPIGIIGAVTGVSVSLNVLAEFIGGSWVEGNALAMCFFKTYGFVTCASALHFSMDLKMAHYLKLPPRFTFWAQMVPTVVSTFVCVAIVQYQITIKDICTDNAPFRFTCPGVNTFFTAALLWGTVGPKKMWGVGGQYVETLIGFPLGVITVVVFWFLGKRYPSNRILRKANPVIMFEGGLIWAPYNISYLWPAVPIGALSWLYLKRKYLELWSKYNFVLSASFSAGIAISALVMFFSLSFTNIQLKWWGNTIVTSGCQGSGGCILKTLAEDEYFGPAPGTYN